MAKQNDKSPLDGMLNMRVSNSELDIFIKKSERMGKPYQQLIREVITSFNDGRLRIIPNQYQKETMGELYNVD